MCRLKYIEIFGDISYNDSADRFDPWSFSFKKILPSQISSISAAAYYLESEHSVGKKKRPVYDSGV